MSDIQNLKSFDPFADTGGNETCNTSSCIHIRIQQRNGRKTLTTVQGIPADIDQKKLLKTFKKDFACNGNLVQHELHGEIIQLQGDQRSKVHDFILKERIVREEEVKIHGF